MQVNWVVKLYPRTWRERYADEMLALLEEHPITPLTIIDLLRGALDAWLHPLFDRRGATVMDSRQRKATLMVFQAWVAYVLAGLVFYGTLDDNPLTQLARTTLGLQWPVYIVQAGAALSLLAMFAGALPVGWGVLRRALTAKRRDVLALMLGVPLLCFIVLATYAVAMFALNSMGQWPGVMMFRVFEGLFVLAAIFSTLAVSAAITRAEPDADLLRFARLPSLLVALAMTVTLVGLIAWAASAVALAPHIFYAAPGVVEAIDTAHSWLLSAVVMAGATLIAVWSISPQRKRRVN